MIARHLDSTRIRQIVGSLRNSYSSYLRHGEVECQGDERGEITPSHHLSRAIAVGITIEGVKTLHGAEYSVIPDRIEAGTFLIAAAITNGELTLDNCVTSHLMAAIDRHRAVRCSVTAKRSIMQDDCHSGPTGTGATTRARCSGPRPATGRIRAPRARAPPPSSPRRRS